MRKAEHAAREEAWTECGEGSMMAVIANVESVKQTRDEHPAARVVEMPISRAMSSAFGAVARPPAATI